MPAYWVDEFHMDGLRLDATQQIFDASRENIMAEIGARVRRAAGARSTIIVSENEPQHTRLVRGLDDGGYGLDALWNDDFHHSAMVALTGRAEAYYSDTRGTPQEMISAAKYGYLFQGQHYDWQGQPRGTSALDLAPAHFVTFLQNHDQVANSATGLRCHHLTSAARWRAMTALFLLMPSTPMLFQGQEFASSAPFLYFADFADDLAKAVKKGRAEFLTQFPSILEFEKSATLDDPSDIKTFARCTLNFTERETHAQAYALHRDLLALRRESQVFLRQSRGGVDGVGARPGGIRSSILRRAAGRRAAAHRESRRPPAQHVVRRAAGGAARRLDVAGNVVVGEPRYGGGGVPDIFQSGRWNILGESAHVLSPVHAVQPAPGPRRRRTA